MSLINNTMENCIIMDARTAPDGRGGVKVSLTEGAPFKANITLDTSTEARVAEQANVKNLYTVLTPRYISLQPQTIFKRLRDGKMFKVTSDGDDKATPRGAGLDFRLVSAKEYTLGDK